MTAPTEAEIRQAIEAELGLPDDPGQILMAMDVPEWMVDALAPLTDSDMARVRQPWRDDYYGEEGHPGTLWADLTTEETDELHAAITNVQRRVLNLSARMLLDEATAAGVAFAKAHPDVPRGHWPLHPEAAEPEAVPA